MARKKERMEKALRMYEKKLQYTKEYQKEKYEKITVVVKKSDVEQVLQSRNLKTDNEKLINEAKKYVAFLKLKSELSNSVFMKADE